MEFAFLRRCLRLLCEKGNLGGMIESRKTGRQWQEIRQERTGVLMRKEQW